jgi:hypothetical protein
MRHVELQAFWLFIIFILIIGGSFFILRKGADQIQPTDTPPIAAKVDLSNVPLFKDGLSKTGITIDNLGYHAFSPDGKYFIFTGIKQNDEMPAKTYLVDLSNGETTLLPGMMLGDFTDSRIVALSEGSDLVLYDIKSGTDIRIKNQENIFAGVLSPDGNTYVFDTLLGIRAYDLNTGMLVDISTSQYDGASAWYVDSQHMLGYHESGENLFEAGKGRILGVWNIRTKEFSPLLEGKIEQKSIRNVTWIVPDSIARVNAGWDDGSFDYLVDIHNDRVVDLGDTSSALMAGMRDDSARGYFAIVRGPVEEGVPVSATLYKGLDMVASVEILGGYSREYVQIVDKDHLLYLRKEIRNSGGISTVELVELNLTDGTETVIKTFSKPFAILSLAPDYETWVVGAGNQFFFGKL